MSAQRKARRRAARKRKQKSPIRFRNRAEFMAAVAAGTFTGEVVHMVVQHGPDCTPERCVCQGECIVEEGTPGNIIAGAEAQERWIRSKAS